MFRTGYATTPAHPFFMWYWGENGRQHLGRVIVVGADNEYIPKLARLGDFAQHGRCAVFAQGWGAALARLTLAQSAADRHGRHALAGDARPALSNGGA